MARQFDHIGDVEAFVAIVDSGTMSAAAVRLGTTPSVLSRAVARLETKLGAQLLRRTTRQLSVTEAGTMYLEHARGAFELLADADRKIQGEDGELAGTIRISAPTTYGHYRLPQLLQAFLALHPRVVVELSIANRNVDLVSEGYDMAIRLGSLPDSGLVAKRLEAAQLCLVAAPGYLRRAGGPAGVAELAQHACLPFVMPSTGRLAPWLLRDEGRDVDWTPPARVRVADDPLGVVSLAEQGAGICQTYRFVAEARVRDGTLVEVLPQSGGRTKQFSLIYPPHRRLSAASRALIDSLAGAISVPIPGEKHGQEYGQEYGQDRE